MKTAYLDANIILRFLLDDHPQMSEAARHLFHAAERQEVRLLVDPVTLEECCFVLTGKYYASRFASKQVIADILTRLLFLPGVEADTVILMETLESFAKHNVDFADAYLATLARHQAVMVASFDQDFRRLDVPTLVPTMESDQGESEQ